MLPTNLSRALLLQQDGSKLKPTKDLRETQYILNKNASIGQIMMSPNFIKKITNLPDTTQPEEGPQLILDGNKIDEKDIKQIELYNFNMSGINGKGLPPHPLSLSKSNSMEKGSLKEQLLRKSTSK
mmetsp:Transcript_28009/g.42350  ORF Transcript_28009/g.42350 Transcript_28009/m.42350 type:complete len:126 (+) Transcript_28009:918-1295(+)|eukprot:CAMPEP_0170487910 /NCGR_PEP_ID=MMETSP0208-20121228/6610_1 /TAXON_ID=197538 /ORGANISM="Strombidium inclinatum, Strain S3" /LENGTH=125 /DNA_ID=CAMNT_0010762339 /DNA_START=970 /DNA_END=1347 /DNA_ORIENTATION=+